jgi:hypothetical protein
MKSDTRLRFEPRLAVEMPQGWIVKEAVELFRIEGGAYVVASGEPLPRGMALDAYVDRYSSELRRLFPNMEEIDLEPFEMLGGRKGVLRHFKWSPPERPGVRQLQAYCVDGGWGYVITATVRDDEGAADAERAVLDLMREVHLKGHPIGDRGRPYITAGTPFDRFVSGEAFVDISGGVAESENAWTIARKGWVSTQGHYS